MKKLFSLLLVATLTTTFVSCESDDNNYYEDYDTISSVYDIRNVDFSYNNGYSIYRQFVNPLYGSDVVLVYKQTGTTSNGNPIWELLPKTYYLNDGNEVDYTFDFTSNDVTIYTGGTFDLSGSQFIRNQTFRIVVIPANYGKGSNTVDTKNYDEVIRYYNINDRVTKTL